MFYHIKYTRVIIAIECWTFEMVMTAFVLYTNRAYVRIQYRSILCCCYGCPSKTIPQQQIELKRRLSQSLTGKERRLSFHLANQVHIDTNLMFSLPIRNGSPPQATQPSPNDKDDTLTPPLVGALTTVRSSSDVDKTTMKDSIESDEEETTKQTEDRGDEEKQSPKVQAEQKASSRNEVAQLAVLDVNTGTDLLRSRSQSKTWKAGQSNEKNNNNNKHKHKKTTQPLELRQLLADKAGFHLFMEHLFAEFSPESLLAYLEMCQFHHKYCQRSVTDCEFHRRFTVNESLPRSAIVYNESFTVSEQIRVLVEKYINQGSLYELNLAYDVRFACLEQCKWDNTTGKSTHELATLFDPVVSSLYDLMESDSFQRFAYTESFRQYTLKHASPPK
ncbi:hypothetical protein RFI_23766 [Reticulomyxa filosa]|uniref:RGS domain-containing protein n=1 Tax=Reticulomyxa filosa TaxID=46433 RepID=X6MI97_RETFI|nr:hypothetical protein RFI_23766 [Reticulomyxa filosa]|eukprot:ETO13599.1 hypothetical protein RFI_23766 [Reticulomyxa filosa]